MKQLLDKKFIKYFITGLTGFTIDLLVLAIITVLFFQGKNFSLLGIMSLPKFISSSVALTFVFFINRNWVFKSNGQKIQKQAIKFVFVSVFNVFLSSILYNLFYTLLEPLFTNFHLAKSILLLSSSVITEALKMVSSFFLYKKAVFK